MLHCVELNAALCYGSFKNSMCFCMQINNEVNRVDPAGEEPWVLEFPLPDKPESINHGSTDGFNFGGSLGFVYEAMACTALSSVARSKLRM